jgi:hypothetical protein
MDPEILDLLKDLSTSPGASEAAINSVAQTFKFLLPDQYVDLMKISDGVAGSIGENEYLIIYSVEHVVAKNKDLPIRDIARDLGLSLFIFGSDGVDLHYGFKQDSEEITVVSVDFYESAAESIDFQANTFNEFLKLLAQG